MSLLLLRSVRDHIQDASLDAGYAFRFLRWSDASIQLDTPFIFITRLPSGGSSNVLLQQTDVLIRLVRGTPQTDATGIEDGDDDISAIVRLFREGAKQPGVTRFEVVGAIVGPLVLENDRPFWDVTVRCYTEGL